MYPGQTHSPKTPWTPLPWDSAGFLKIPWTPGTLWTPRLHRLPDSWTPLFLSLHGLSDSMDSQDSLDSQGIPPEDFSGLQRAGANRSSDSPMHRRLSWPMRTPSGHSFPSAALPPSSGEPEALPASRWPQACRIWEASGVRARERPNPRPARPSARAV